MYLHAFSESLWRETLPIFPSRARERENLSRRETLEERGGVSKRKTLSLKRESLSLERNSALFSLSFSRERDSL